MLGRLSGRFGWRGLWLLTMGVLWVLLGVGQLLSPLEPHPWVLVQWLPAWVRAAGWCTTGLVAIGVGARGAQPDDAAGHVALYLMPAVQVFSYAVAWLVWLCTLPFPGGAQGWADGWYAAAVWAVLSWMLALGANWPNPRPPLPHPPAGAQEDGARE